jgi:CheY-like chemotaxis protein
MADGVRVIATNNVDVFRHLAAAPLVRAGVTWSVVPDYEALLAAVRRAPPTIALIDAVLAGGSGAAACRAIKDDPATAHVRVAIIIAARGFDRAAALALAASGCDEVLAPPLSFDDFCSHLSRMSPVPLRRDRRIATTFAVELLTPTIAAHIANVGTGGLGLRVASAMAIGAVVQLRISMGAEPGPTTHARVAWCRAIADATDLPFAAGLAWEGEPPLRTRLVLEQVALFDVEASPVADAPGAVDVTLHGDFTEMTRFESLAAQLADAHAVSFDLAAVRYISSAGVRAWCELLAQLGHAHLTFRHCSLAFTSQAAMVPMVLAGGSVQSFVAPYYCDRCGLDDDRLLEVGAVARDGDRLIAPSLACHRCAGPSELDDLPERYFAFLAGG